MICKTIALRDDHPGVTLSTFLWEPSPELVQSPRPAVLVCPGGAYLNCSDREADPIALRFAAMGYHAFVLRYATFLGKPGIPGPGSEGDPAARHPGPMRDLARAMLCLRDHAAAWNLDAERIAICGFSAGAHNCAMYGTYWNAPVLTGFFGRPAADFRPAASILGYPLTDYTTLADGLEGLAKMLFGVANRAFFGVENPNPAQLDEASPARHTGAQTPPTFLWHTAADNLVPVQQSAAMIAALAAAGVPFEAHIFESGPHGLSTADQASAGDSSQLDADAARWLPLVERWLAKRFALEIPAPRPFTPPTKA